MTWSLDEWFVVALARTIRDREVTFHGFGSPCAQVAMTVAKRTHAGGMMLVEGATYACDPDPPFIPPTGNEASLQRGAAYRMRFEEFFDAAVRGDVDRMFLSGGQIDAYGNTNVTAIGALDYAASFRTGVGAALRLHHRHGPPHARGQPHGAGLFRRWTAMVGHRAGDLRLRHPRACQAAPAVP